MQNGPPEVTGTEVANTDAVAWSDASPALPYPPRPEASDKTDPFNSTQDEDFVSGDTSHNKSKSKEQATEPGASNIEEKPKSKKKGKSSELAPSHDSKKSKSRTIDETAKSADSRPVDKPKKKKTADSLPPRRDEKVLSFKIVCVNDLGCAVLFVALESYSKDKLGRDKQVTVLNFFQRTQSKLQVAAAAPMSLPVVERGPRMRSERIGSNVPIPRETKESSGKGLPPAVYGAIGAALVVILVLAFVGLYWVIKQSINGKEPGVTEYVPAPGVVIPPGGTATVDTSTRKPTPAPIDVPTSTTPGRTPSVYWPTVKPITRAPSPAPDTPPSTATTPATTTSTRAKASTATPRSPTVKWDTEIESCGSTDCREVKTLMDTSLDKKREPCQDFYGFVCSDAEKNYAALYNNVQGGTLKVLEHNISSQIRREIESPVPLQRQTVFQKSAAFFQHCRDVKIAVSSNLDGVKHFLEQYGMNFRKDMSLDPLDMTVKFVFEFDIPILFNFTAERVGTGYDVVVEEQTGVWREEFIWQSIGSNADKMNYVGHRVLKNIFARHFHSDYVRYTVQCVEICIPDSEKQASRSTTPNSSLDTSRR
ncbi:uncharacterized protein LOC135384512 [Ornithodoros turicata]|uniref:uncharacterized protein LOC135384512 n=1 Tax=Ornithodoros turicata TaxID=34597 RepID=UPI00313983CC